MIRLSIRRPVAIAMTYFAVALLGVAAWRNIPIELLPDTDLPRLTVRATWRGASPETVEAFLTSQIESEVQQIKGVEEVRSTSTEQSARIEVSFSRDADMDFVRLELSERMATLEEDLPPGIGRITVTPYVPDEFADQNLPLMRYTYTGPFILEALKAHLDDVAVPELSQLEGVAYVQVNGGRDRLLRIELEEEEMVSLGLTPAMVRQRITDLDLVGEAGAIREGDQELTLTIQNRAMSVRDILDAPIISRAGVVVQLRDISRIYDSFEEARSYYRIDALPAVGFSVVKEIGANSVEVAESIREKVAALEARSLPGASFVLDSDQSEEIKRQLTDLRSRALVSAVVIFMVLLLFLRSFRTTVVIFFTIVFSILISLNLLYFQGMSLNLLTLMGLAMGFGLIVDNSIVVLENIYRRWQEGEDPEKAANHGARQVVLPILASTATTVIVFVPFVYLQGELRIYYFPLAVVVGFTLFASLFVAFTFIPALAARILRRSSKVPIAVEPSAQALSFGGVDDQEPSTPGEQPTASPKKRPFYLSFYSDLVGFAVRYPWVAIVVTAVCFGGSFWAFEKNVNRGALWGGLGNQRSFVRILVSLPRGSDLARTDELVRFFEDKLKDVPEVERFVSQVNADQSVTSVFFPDSLEFTPIPLIIKEQMEAYSLGFTGAEVRVRGIGPSFYPGGVSSPNYSITIRGYNFKQVQAIAEDLGGRLARQPRIYDMDTNASGGFGREKATEYTVQVDRTALARYGLDVLGFSQRLGSVMQGAIVPGTMKIGGEEVNYDVKFEGAHHLDLFELRETILTGLDGTGIRVGDVALLDERDILASILRENQQYQRRISYEFRGPRKLGDAFRDGAVAATVLPPGYSIETSRGFAFSREQELQIYFVLAVSILLIYMVTAALFESLRQPLCVLLTVPMALIGVFLIFVFMKASFTREAYIGVIMMGGIVVNNAILLVDHINQVRRETDQPLFGAILQGTLERVRPILMTAATTVLGLLPLVLFSRSADANIWNALGYVLIGGMLSSTLFVLTTTPALYYLFERRKAAAL